MTEETKHIYLFCPRVGMKYIPVYDSIRSFPPGEYYDVIEYGRGKSIDTKGMNLVFRCEKVKTEKDEKKLRSHDALWLNQGYCIDHSYGHGDKNLCINFYLLTLMAFAFHQVFELTDKIYQECRRHFGSKRHLWENLRAYLRTFVFDTWELLLDFTLNPENYNTDRPILSSA